MARINAVTDLTVEGSVGIITIDSPPVNAVSALIRQGLKAAVEAACSDQRVRALVLICAGRTFFAGADITEFGAALAKPSLHDVQASIEEAIKPVVAAIHGAALGGGLEIALVCHYRVAVASARLGLPEVRLGLLPGAGGTQRLPRIVGAPKALEMMLNGDTISAADGFTEGLIDELAPEGALRAAAIAVAERVGAGGQPLPRIRDRNVTDAEPALFAKVRASYAEAFRGYDAHDSIIQCVEASTQPFEIGMAIEAQLFDELMGGRQAAAQRHLFFAERLVAKVPGLAPGIDPHQIRRMAISAAVPTAFADMFRSVGVDVETVHPDAGMAEYDVLIVKAPSDVALYRKGLRSNAVLLATSDDIKLRCNEIQPGRTGPMLGFRAYFSEAMPKLIETVRDAQTEPATIAAIMALIKRTGILAVHSRGGGRSIGDHLSAAFGQQISELVRRGVSSGQIDEALCDFGFPRGMVERIKPASFELPPGATKASERFAPSMIVLRCLSAIADEGARLIACGIAAGPADIDVVCVHAFGWPRHSGGPMFHSNSAA